MKKLMVILGVCAFAKAATAQSYVDLVKINYGTVINAGYEGDDAETNVKALDVSLTYPIKLSEKTAIITGVDYSSQSLDLFPNAAEATLSYVTFKAGLSLTHSEKWSGTYILLPKIASQDLKTDDAFFIGGLALLKYQKSANFQYRLGAYGSTEAFGVLMTPILGFYYQSENRHWEATLNMPINGDVNYEVNERSKLGIAFQAPVRSFRLQDENADNLHVQSNIIELGPYLEHSFSKQSILLRFQAGYTSVGYEVFDNDDQLPFRLSAFEFGDDRNRLNPDMNGSLFVEIGAVYRFQFEDKQEVIK